jgi:hypothetical protein
VHLLYVTFLGYFGCNYEIITKRRHQNIVLEYKPIEKAEGFHLPSTERLCEQLLPDVGKNTVVVLGMC